MTFLMGFASGDRLVSLLHVWVFLFLVAFHLSLFFSNCFLNACFVLKSSVIVKMFWERRNMHTLISPASSTVAVFYVPLSIVPLGLSPPSGHETITSTGIPIEHRAFGIAERTKCVIYSFVM